MKHLVIAGLLTAIGALALTPVAHADSQYCYDNPDDNRCDYDPNFMPRLRLPPPPQDYGNSDNGGGNGYGGNGYGGDGYGGDGYAGDGSSGRRRRPPQDFGNYAPPPPPRDWGMDSRQRFCMMVGRSLRQQGYRGVRAVECGGKNFKYTAFRSGVRYLVKVKARTGQIMYAIPN